MQQRLGWQFNRGIFDSCPSFSQISNVFTQLSISRIFGIGPQNKAAALISHQVLQALPEGIALFGRNFLGHADVVVLRQKNKVPASDANLGRQPSTLGSDGVLDDLHHQGLTFKHLLLDRNQRLRTAGHLGRLTLRLAMPHIGHMQKCSAL